MKVSRRNLLQTSASAGLASSLLGRRPVPSDSFYLQLVKAGDASIPTWLEQLKSATLAHSSARRVGEAIEVLTAAFCAPESSYQGSANLIGPMQSAADSLLQVQYADGTIDAGNLHSPPDTGFVLETVCTALAVLRQAKDARVAGVEDRLAKFAIAGGKALTIGGIHTPNHRWVVSSALARVNSIFPDSKYVNRIDDWLGEGIYCDLDGQFCERSVGIYSRVIDNALITLARLLHRPALLAPVRRNLDMNVYYTHPDGEVETIGSRRQDATMTSSIATYYLQYRYLAIIDRNAQYAGMVELIETMQAAQVKRANPLINFLEEPLLKAGLPEAAPLPSSYAKLFANSGLARIRREAVSATVFGGTDWPLGVASGLSSNPTFFTYRKGKAILESVRMGAQFFSLGAFRSSGLTTKDGHYVLQQKLDVPYYQPLPASERNAHGDYELTPVRDGRFWSKLNFPKRRMSNIQSLVQTVTIAENGGGFDLHIDVSGHVGVPFTIEFAFRTGGKMEGNINEQGANTYFLAEGNGRYRVGGDWIDFGPGQVAHDYVHLEGSSYLAHHGSLRPSGPCAYITALTPIRKIITIRST